MEGRKGGRIWTVRFWERSIESCHRLGCQIEFVQPGSDSITAISRSELLSKGWHVLAFGLRRAQEGRRPRAFGSFGNNWRRSHCNENWSVSDATF